MFTLKVSQGGTTSIRTVKDVTIAKRGSEQFNEAMGYAKELGIKNPNYIEYVPEVGEPKDHTVDHVSADDVRIIQYEQLLENGERKGVDGEPIAVILEDSSAFCMPFDETMAGTAYNFIYQGDEVYVMNQSGSTIEAIK